VDISPPSYTSELIEFNIGVTACVKSENLMADICGKQSLIKEKKNGILTYTQSGRNKIYQLQGCYRWELYKSVPFRIVLLYYKENFVE
jgi:hypothetical protein